MPRPTSFDHVLSKGDAGMPRPMSFDRVCFSKARWQATPDVVRPFVLPKGDDGMQRPTSSTVCAVQRR